MPEYLKYDKTITTIQAYIKYLNTKQWLSTNYLRIPSRKVTDFTRAMPEYLKYDTTITTIQAYIKYLNTKPWMSTNYLRIPSRKPSFIV